MDERHARLSDILTERGYVHQCTAPTLAVVTDGQPRTVYLGVDPTGDSLHVGHLVTYMAVRHFAAAGHRVILLVGGGTGMIGDPKPDVERPLLSPEVVARNVAALSAQVRRVVGLDTLTVVDNADWLSPLTLIGFLRDIGKHFTVNVLMKKDAIAERLKSDEGITYTEFAYPLLQAYDFMHLHNNHGCDVQVGGSDQWGNITAGVDLIRRTSGDEVFGITVPLVIDKATGKKFGKSEGNAVWLDAQKTSPFQFYQFWLQASDESVEEYLKLFTLLSLDEIATVMAAHSADKGVRTAQRTLALKVTELIHGVDTAHEVATVSDALFSGSHPDISMYGHIKRVAPVTKVTFPVSVVDALVLSGLASSKREAKEFITAGAVLLNGVPPSAETLLSQDDCIEGMMLVKRGKRNVAVLVAE